MRRNRNAMARLYPVWIALQLQDAASLPRQGERIVEINRLTDELVKRGCVRARDDVSREAEWDRHRSRAASHHG